MNSTNSKNSTDSKNSRNSASSIILVFVFAVAFGIVEGSVVVYLRAIYYPNGFSFPLRILGTEHLMVECFREASTIVMLGAVGMLAGRRRWERFGYFLVAFGVWDLSYYGWLKLTLGWPVSITDWDVLFLLPTPWIAPVLAPAMIALLMIVLGVLLVLRISREFPFHPTVLSWVLGGTATIVLLFSFMEDISATLSGQVPAPYRYSFLFLGMLMYIIGFAIACRPHDGKVSRA